MQGTRSFPPSKSFLRASRQISRSRVFRLLQRMPKGGVLHAHISAVNSRDFVLGNITLRPNLYVCRRGQDGGLRLRFLDEARARSRRAGCRWELLATARLRDRTIDREIAEALTMYTEDPASRAQGSDGAWRKFLSIFCFIKSLVTYRLVPVILSMFSCL